MDRHDVSEAVTAENVAQLHQQDLKIQDQFDCRGLTYWFDDIRKTAFCLIEAPTANHIVEMHNHAHGEVPHRVIEVDSTIVESFLGRIEDPEKAQDTQLNIINDPAFRILSKTCIVFRDINPQRTKELKTFLFDTSRQLALMIRENDGRIVNHSSYEILGSFKVVSHAIHCAQRLRQYFNRTAKHFHAAKINLNVGICAGVPVTEKNTLFEETIQHAGSLCFAAMGETFSSFEVSRLFMSENNNEPIEKQQARSLAKEDEEFIISVSNLLTSLYQNPEVNVEFLYQKLGYSKSKFYRKITSLYHISPYSLLLNFRLNHALQSMLNEEGNISEIAFNNGFINPSYFTKCFHKHFGITPTEFIQQIICQV